METTTRAFVRRRAKNQCEYCLLRQEFCALTHHVEHIVSRQHGGLDDIENLALACQRCNLRKGPNLTGVDPETGAIVQLFHPRRNAWTEHFQFRGAKIEGLTPIGRVTANVLGMNDPRRLELRSELLAREEPG